MFADSFRVFVSAILIIAAAWLSFPERNLYGSPTWEELSQECATPDGTIVRLYVGNAGATTSFWYSVTTEYGFWSLEKQVMYAYSGPKLTSIACGKDHVIISSPNYEFSFTEAELHSLREAPRAYSAGENNRTRSWSLSAFIKLAASLTIAAAGLHLIRPVYLRILKHRASDAV